jgi:hypothetical protein
MEVRRAWKDRLRGPDILCPFVGSARYFVSNGRMARVTSSRNSSYTDRLPRARQAVSTPGEAASASISASDRVGVSRP